MQSMDIQIAQTILQLPPNFVPADIKKQYHRLSLKFHPDKNNNSIDANRKFREINEAYRFLTENECNDNESYRNYDDILFDLIGLTYKNSGLNNDLFIFIKSIIANYSKFSQSSLDDISSDVLIHCYKFLNHNRESLGISPHLMDILNTVMKKGENTENVHIITPNLKDMYDSNILRLNYKEKLYLIPLWHSELSFDIDNTNDELNITCIPNLPEHMSLDNSNNLHIYIRMNVQGLLDKKSLNLDIDIIKLSILVQGIKIIRHQTIVYAGKGIPRIDENDIYNNESKGDLIVHIELY